MLLFHFSLCLARLQGNIDTRLKALEANISALSHEVTAAWSSGDCCGGPVDDDLFVRFKLDNWKGPRDHFHGSCTSPCSGSPCSGWPHNTHCRSGQVCNFGTFKNDCIDVPSMPAFPPQSEPGTKLLSRTPMLYTHDAGTGWVGPLDGRSSWMKTQEITPLHQLQCGARMLDARVHFDGKTNRFDHGGALVDQSLETDMGSFLSFARDHPNDLIVLYISHCAKPTNCRDPVHTKVLVDNDLLMLDSDNSAGWQDKTGGQLLEMSKAKSGHGLVTP